MNTPVISLGKEWWKIPRPEASPDKKKPIVTRIVKPILQTDYLTVKEVAAKLRRSYNWVLEQIHSGALYAQPMPQGYLIPVYALEDYLARLRDIKKLR